MPITADVDDALSGSAEEDADYDAFGTQTVTFAVGSADGDTQPVSVGVLDDLLLEGPETVDLQITGVAGPGASIGAQNDHVVTILDDERVDVAFELAASSAAEAVESRDVRLRLIAGPGVTLALAVEADVVDAGTGTASSGDDYAAPGTLTAVFAAGASDGSLTSVSLDTIDDLFFENDETVDLAISTVHGPGASLGAPADHTMTIVNDDPLPDLRVSAALIDFVSKNGDPTPFDQAEVGDLIVLQMSVASAPTGGATRNIDGRVYIELGFDQILLGTFQVPLLNPGQTLPIEIVPNILLPRPPVALAGSQFEW